MNRIRVRPSKSVSTMGMIIGVVFVGIGLFIAIPTFGLFGVFWTLGAAAVTGFHAINSFTKRGVAVTEIDLEGSDVAGTHVHASNLPFDERLRRLEQLHRDGLINQLEFEQKRRELLREQW